MFTQVNDQRSKAHVVLNHSVLYSPEQTAWAQGVLDGDTAALSIHGPRHQIPIFNALRVRPVRSHGAVAGARNFATLAVADDVLRHPATLQAYAATFSGADDATLIVFGTSSELERLGRLMSELGLSGSEAADVLGLVSDLPDAALVSAAASVDAVLT